MNRLYLHILMSVVTALTLAACDKEDAELKEVRDYPIFTATIEGNRTRAYDTSWEDGAQIGITAGNKNNIRHDIKNLNGLFEVYESQNQFFFTDNNPVEFIAYYPYYSYQKSPGIISYAQGSKTSKLTTTTQANQKNFDFLWAKASGSKLNPNVDFNFVHVMSKISFVFKNGEDMNTSEIYSYTLNGFVATGQFDTNIGICSTTTTSTSSMTVTVNGNAQDGVPTTPCIVFPQTLAKIPVQLSIRSTGSSPYIYLACQLPFKSPVIEAGKEYRFVITVNKTGLTVNQTSINDWVNNDQGSWEAM